MRARGFAAVLLLLVMCSHAWGDIKVRLVQQAAATSTGTQDFLSGSFGTPKAALAFLSSGVTNGTAANHALLAIGGTDCFDQWAVHVQDLDGGPGGVSDTNRRGTHSFFLELYQNDGTTIDGQATVTCISNGLRLTWTLALSQPYLVQVVLFGGSDLSAQSSTFFMPTSVGGVTDVNTVGFQPNDVFLAFRAANVNDSNIANARLSLGIANSTSQGSLFWTAVDGAAVTDLASGVHTTYALTTGTGGSWPAEACQVGSFDSQGFSCTRQIGGTSADVVYYLALAYGGAARSWNGPIPAPASTGPAAFTSPGWRPQFLFVGMTAAATAATRENDDDAGVYAVSLNTATEQYAVGIRSDDGLSSSTDTSSLVDNRSVNVLSATGSTRWSATLSSLDASGWTWNVTTTSGSAVWYGWAIEATALTSARRRGQHAIWFR